MTKTHKIAILGFGVVGGGVAKLVTDNKKELEKYLGCTVEIGKILDLRDFPGSPFESLVTHNYDDILTDKSIDTIVEVMGGSHPAYEYTVAALKSGKNVITSNKEVVANFGDEFVYLAKQNGVSYRFEAAVGGGIPIISPLLSSVRQNKVKEVRGILNGTTNYILTKMFTYGDSFENALRDAQEKGYAERNPDADILGTDACRKITILTAIAFDMLLSVSEIPTEGITAIRSEDVKAAGKIGHKIKLLGRCIYRENGAPYVMVAPFLLPPDSPLSGVNGVYNAIEVVGEPLGNVMFYGQGAGAGATASAVVGDLAPIIAYKGSEGISPKFERKDLSPKNIFPDFESRKYIALPKTDEKRVKEIFGNVTVLDCDKETHIISEYESEAATEKKLSAIGYSPISLIRFL